MITAGLTIEEFYEATAYTDCPFNYKCENCEWDCNEQGVELL